MKNYRYIKAIFAGILLLGLFMPGLLYGQADNKNGVPDKQEELEYFDIHAKIEPISVGFALLIGYDINERNPTRLPEYSSNDVQKMAEFLVANGWQQDHIVEMTGQSAPVVLKPTRDNILANLRLVAAMVQPQDTIFVMISGIGGIAENEQWYLPQGATSLKSERWISQREILDILRQSPSQFITVMNLTDRYQIHAVTPETVAATAMRKKNNPEKNVLSADQKAKSTITLISSCSFDEESLESHSDQLDLFLSSFFTVAENKEVDNTPFSWANLFTQAQSLTQSRAEEESEVQNPEIEKLSSKIL